MSLSDREVLIMGKPNPQHPQGPCAHSPASTPATLPLAGPEAQHLLFPAEAIARLSHELCTPLSSIKESIALLQHEQFGALTPAQQELAKTVESTTGHLLILVRQLLDLSRARLGAIELLRRPLLVEPLVHESCTRLKTMMGHRHMSVQAGGLPLIFGDRDRLLQVLLNLLTNAVKCTDDSGHITVTATAREGMVDVAILDDGCGMSQERLSEVFHPFTAAHGQASLQHGTGLGLTICKELVELHGGKIQLTSRSGQGTTVTVTIPMFTPARAVEMLIQEVREAQAPTEPAVTVCLVRLLGLARRRSSRPALEERVEGTLRDHLRAADRLSWCDPESLIIVASTDLAGARQLMARLRETERNLSQVAGGSMELLWGLSCSIRPGDRTAEDLLYEAQLNLNRMIGTR